MGKTKLKKNDTVVVLSGKDKGKSGKILQIDRKNDKVLVQGINLVRKAVKKRKQSDQGGIIEVESSLHISKVAFAGKNHDPTRIGYVVKDGKKQRVSKKNGEVL